MLLRDPLPVHLQLLDSILDSDVILGGFSADSGYPRSKRRDGGIEVNNRGVYGRCGDGCRRRKGLRGGARRSGMAELLDLFPSVSALLLQRAV